MVVNPVAPGRVIAIWREFDNLNEHKIILYLFYCVFLVINSLNWVVWFDLIFDFFFYICGSSSYQDDTSGVESERRCAARCLSICSAMCLISEYISHRVYSSAIS